MYSVSRFDGILLRAAQHEGEGLSGHMSADASTQAALRRSAQNRLLNVLGPRVIRAMCSEELPDWPAFAAKLQASNLGITLIKVRVYK